MIKDLADLGRKELEADVCIVGAGPAGIVLALELARRRPEWKVVLSEGGTRRSATARERELYRVGMGERRYLADASRRRTLGGTSAHWGGWCKPFDAADFAEREGWPLPGWPFGPGALAPYLPAAHAWCEIDSDDYDIAALQSRHPERLLDLPADGFLSQTLFRFSPPTRFGPRYAAELEAQPNLDCLLQANLFQLERRGERIAAAHVRSLDGPACRIRARHVVLAMGGLENTRHLLILRDRGPSDGEGLHSPHLGRHFADHFGARPGQLLAPAGLGYTRFRDETGPVMPVLVPSPAALAHGSARNSCLMLDPEPHAEGLGKRYAGQAGLGFRPGEYWTYRVTMINEPRPHPESRLSLLDERCELGLPRLHVDWRIEDSDFAAIDRLFLDVGRELARLGLGRARLTHPDSPESRGSKQGAFHPMGTTRMAGDPRDGVVDPDCRVFDLENLHLAGSSLFPRYGHANPTLTVVALAIRLAEQLANGGQAA